MNQPQHLVACRLVFGSLWWPVASGQSNTQNFDLRSVSALSFTNAVIFDEHRDGKTGLARMSHDRRTENFMRLNVWPYWLWALLAVLPLQWMSISITSLSDRIFHRLVHPSGEWAAYLLIVTLMITPLTLLIKGTSLARWMRKSRRYFGVAAFAYALVHTVFYLIDKGSWARVMGELPRFYIWTGWIAFLIFIPLALTSMDYAVRRMGPNWKRLQRLTYLAAVLTLLHWASLHNWRHPETALITFAPLIALEIMRVGMWVRRRVRRRGERSALPT